MPRRKIEDKEVESIVADSMTDTPLPVPLPKRGGGSGPAARKGVDKLAQIQLVTKKVFKADTNPLVEVDASSLRQSKPHLPSGSTVLDYLIGGRPNKFNVAPCPGWPKGQISNIFGQESSGKTTVALTTAANTCASGGQVVFIDWEHAISTDYASAIGVPVADPTQFALYQPNTLEDGLKILYLAVKAGVELIILDSVGAGIPQAVFDQSIEEQGNTGQVGLVARIWGVFLPKVTALASSTGSHVMGISQLRKKIGMTGYGPDTTHQGGEAWKFYSAVRMDFRRVKSIKTKDYDALQHKSIDRYTSAVIKAKVIKSKVAATQQAEAEFYITFGKGIDDMMSIIDIALAHGILHKGGAWYTWERGNGETVRGCGVEGVRQQILAADGGWAELKDSTVRAMCSGRPIEMITGDDVEEEDPVDLDDLLGTKPKKGTEDDDSGSDGGSDE